MNDTPIKKGDTKSTNTRPTRDVHTPPKIGPAGIPNQKSGGKRGK